MFDNPLLLLAAFALAVSFGRYMHASYMAAAAALANRLRPRHEAPSDAALRLRGIEPAVTTTAEAAVSRAAAIGAVL